jgi:hypothetical protein
MNQQLNDLAILITKKIENELVMLCYSVTQADPKTIRQAPNFYMIRHNILTALSEVMASFSVQINEAPESYRDIPPATVLEIQNYNLKKQAATVVEHILSSDDYVDKYVYEDEWSLYRSTTRTIVLVKAAAIKKGKS